MGFTVTVSFARGYFLGSESLYLTGAGMARAVFFFSSRLPPVLLARFAAQLLRGAIVNRTKCCYKKWVSV